MAMTVGHMKQKNRTEFLSRIVQRAQSGEEFVVLLKSKGVTPHELAAYLRGNGVSHSNHCNEFRIYGMVS
jgi:hypothetical protein